MRFSNPIEESKEGELWIPKTLEQLKAEDSFGHEHDEDDEVSGQSMINPGKQSLGVPMKPPLNKQGPSMIASACAKQGDFGALAISSLP